MNSILELLAGQNSILSSALVGGIFGMVGGIVGAILVKLKPELAPNKKFILPIIIAMFVTIGVAIINPALESFKREAKLDQQVQKLINDYKVFEIIFKAYPEEERNFRKLMSEARSKNDAYEAGQDFSKTIITKYFLPNLVQAPDNLITEYTVNSGRILYAIQPNPTACLEYFNGINSPSTIAILPKDLVQKELDIKGSIIEAGIKNDQQVSLQSMQDAMNKIYAKYQEYGYDPNEIRTLFAGKNLTPKDGCDMAIRFTYTLASMKDSGAQTLKTLVYYQLNPNSK